MRVHRQACKGRKEGGSEPDGCAFCLTLGTRSTSPSRFRAPFEQKKGEKEGEETRKSKHVAVSVKGLDTSKDFMVVSAVDEDL